MLFDPQDETTASHGLNKSKRPARTLTSTDRRRHAVVVGATGSGKTYDFALPVLAGTLRETDESIVVTNLKGPAGTEEIWALVHTLPPDATVLVFAPGDVTHSIACNLVSVDRQPNRRSPRAL